MFGCFFTFCVQTFAWDNHTLISRALLESMPEVRDAAPVKVESLQSFLLANEEALATHLQNDEAWMQENLWNYQPRPQDLAFAATGNEKDVVMRFKRAIRINPEARLGLYAQLPPSYRLDNMVPITLKEVSVFNDLAHMNPDEFMRLQPGQTIAPLHVAVSANDEPDHGLDIGLFTDSGTAYGKEYGFGEQAFGNPNLEYGTQAPFHMAFYHESPVLYALGGFLKRTYPEMRIYQYQSLARFAFAQGHDYWGWRFMGLGLHYIGDFSNPYHVTPVPGNSTLSTLWVGLLNLLGLPDAQKEATQLVSNRHTVLEEFQSQLMTLQLQEGNHEHETLKSLAVEYPVNQYRHTDPVNLFSKVSADKADHVHHVLADTIPHAYVMDVNVEYTDLDATDELLDTVKLESGDAGFNQLTNTVSDLLADFSRHGSAYVQHILQAK
ncbi:hypothetical protein HF888_01180 [Bermanella marisrubri]|nr:hypothetical protein HF888_01180 [Bermanella marisrubri]